RADDLDRKFLDGVVTLSKNLYDFGVVEYKTNAEILRKEALKLEYRQAFSSVLQRLLNTTNDVIMLDRMLAGLGLDIDIANNTIKEIKLRFTSGIGTIMDVRQAQLSLLDLQTEAQTLKEERLAKVAILKNEFGIQNADLNIVNQAIVKFGQRLINNKQSLEFTISDPIQYERSKKIINFEKSALSSQIKSLKSENMPQLNASITGVIYDLTRKADEHEIYGGINLTVPLFDSGLSKVKKRGLMYRIKVQNDMMSALKQDKFLELNKLTKKYQNLKIESITTKKKEINLSEKLKQITQRSAVVEEGLLSKFQTQLRLNKIKRDLASYPFKMQSLNINYWALNEQLIEKMSIHPAK
ncbi:MAG: TolC family protein, partial [Candidatus Marinimicrobia bacterium]|nr:TolC family protein [Candidatus Neomarinimicrobiota bacterium]